MGAPQAGKLMELCANYKWSKLEGRSTLAANSFAGAWGGWASQPIQRSSGPVIVWKLQDHLTPRDHGDLHDGDTGGYSVG